MSWFYVALANKLNAPDKGHLLFLGLAKRNFSPKLEIKKYKY